MPAGEICSHPQQAVWAKGPGPRAKLYRTRDLERLPQGTGGALPQIKYTVGGGDAHPYAQPFSCIMTGTLPGLLVTVPGPAQLKDTALPAPRPQLCDP